MKRRILGLLALAVAAHAESTVHILPERIAHEVALHRLLELPQLPPCETPRVGGVQLKLRASGLQMPKGAKLSIILLSKANHWMPLGDIDLAKVTAE